MKESVYLFDLDGTLIDSMPVGVKMLLDFLDEYKISYPEDIVDVLLPLGYKGIAAYYAKEMGIPLSAEEIFARFLGKLLRLYEEEIPLKPTVKETLLALKERGARLCVLSASPRCFIDGSLKRTGIYDLFEKVWGIEDFGTTKGDLRIYQAAAERLGVAVKDIRFVDDALHALKVAKKAGVKTVGVYEKYSTSTEEEIRAVADTYVHTLRELL